MANSNRVIKTTGTTNSVLQKIGTVADCWNLCYGNSAAFAYLYAGVENGQECFCGNNLVSNTDAGALQADFSSCNALFANNSELVDLAIGSMSIR